MNETLQQLRDGMNVILAGTRCEAGENEIIFHKKMWEIDTETGATATFWATPTSPHLEMQSD
jgi:hypothetical protein